MNLEKLPPTTHLRGEALLLHVADLIDAEPKRLDMDIWIGTVDFNAPACGTVGCIAGWTCIAVLNAALRNDFIASGLTTVKNLAAQMLELDDRHVRGFSNLFYQENWPEPWKQKYRDATMDERPKVTTAYMRHFAKEYYHGNTAVG